MKASLNEEELSYNIKKLLQLDGPALLEVKVKKVTERVLVGQQLHQKKTKMVLCET